MNSLLDFHGPIQGFQLPAMTRLSARSIGRRLKSAKAGNRGVWGTDSAAGAMGIWPRGISVGGMIGAIGPVGFPQTIGAGVVVNECAACLAIGATGLAMPSRANLAC